MAKKIIEENMEPSEYLKEKLKGKQHYFLDILFSDKSKSINLSISKCAIFVKVGDCVMPREGIFARVIKSGEIKTGDKIFILK